MLLPTRFPESETYIEGILTSDGSGWIAGAPKLGKSYLALDEAICLALGIPVAGRFPVPERRRVYYVSEEDSPQRLKRRVRTRSGATGSTRMTPL